MRETPHPAGTTSLRGLLALLILSAVALACSPDISSDIDPSLEQRADAPDPQPGAHSVARNEALEDAMPEGWLLEHPIISPNAQLELHWAAVAERARARDPRDGAGRVWVEQISPIGSPSGPQSSQHWQREDARPGAAPELEAGTRQRIHLVFEVAESGIDEGGLIFLQADPFWSWSEAQTERPDAPGYVTAVPRAPGVELIPTARGVSFEVRGRGLRASERIDLVYGAGPAGARVDAYAEKGAPFFVGVDASGDGTRGWLKEPARIDIRARAAARLVAFAPADIAPGTAFEISVAVVDRVGNRAEWPAQSEPLSGTAPGCEGIAFELTRLPGSLPLEIPSRLTLQEDCASEGRHTLSVIAPKQEGTLRLRIQGLGPLDGLKAELNPVVVRDAQTRLVWGDLHGHSQFSDGTGTPDDYFRYARDVARLDAIALTDHDHWGIRPLDESPELVDHLRETTARFNAPGRFITLPGYEWTNWVHGHRHVLSFDDALPFYSALDPETDRPDELWAALRGQRVLTFAHHSAGEPIATNWFYRPDPVLEPVTEIASVHGMSEAPDAPAPVRGGEPGYFVRDTLLRGDRLGFIGSGDSHDGHPGLAEIASGQSGLAGLMTRELSRPALLESLRRRHTFATNGIRPFLEVHLDDVPMGGALQAAPSQSRTQGAELTLRIRYEGTEPIQRIDLIRSGRIASLEGESRISLDLMRTIPPLLPGEFHYVRIIQEDGGVAWSSPIFVDAAADSP
ncbi:MAG: CehA/McbA family metallohydrolase [Myxococcota bacterium]